MNNHDAQFFGRSHELRFVKKGPRGKTFDARAAEILFGYHTIKFTIVVPRSALKWKKLRRIGIITGDMKTGLKIRGKDYWARQDVKQEFCGKNSGWTEPKVVRLSYRYNRLIMTFEPSGDFPFEGSDLLPIEQWSSVWPRIAELVENHVECPCLFTGYPVSVSRLDLGFDILCPETTKLIRSLGTLPVDQRSGRVKSQSPVHLKFSSRSRRPSKEASTYDRKKKSGGHEIVRLELRCQNPAAIRRGLGFEKGETLSSSDIGDRRRMAEYIEKSLRTCGIFPDSMIVPLYAAKKYAENESLLKWLKGVKSEADLLGDRYRIKRLHQIEGLTIGTLETKGVYYVEGLHEALLAALRRSFGL
ncbi:hypothetical protein KJZ99_08125 [bacterium]|nr:hypothetical protein [bacterium]